MKSWNEQALTQPSSRSIVNSMRTPDMNQKTDLELSRLEYRIDELVRMCAKLKHENRELKLQQERLISDRASLWEKHELTKTRVEAMIKRLKTME